MKWSGARPMILGLSLSLTAGGCSLVPAYRRPDIPVPGTWTTADAQASPHAVPVRSDWWQSFGSSELSALESRSLEGNFNLQAAIARIEEARATAEVAGAPLYPTLGLGADVSRGTGVSASTGQRNRSHTQDLFAQASYELDFWGGNRAAAHSAQALANASGFDRQTVALTLSASVADTYFQILSLQERVRLTQQIADSARSILALVEVQAAAGVASQLQIEQQRNQVAVFDAAIPVLRQQLDQNMHLLAVLAGGVPEGFSIDAVDLGKVLAPEVQPDLPASVLQRRPDIQAAEARLVSANFDVGVARAAFYPNLTLTAQGGVASGSLNHFFPAAALTNVAATLAQPVFNGGQLQGQLRLDRARTVELAASYRQTVVTALQDVEDALSAMARVKELETAEQTAVESAQRASDLAQAQYRFGVADFLTVLTAERTLYQAQDALLQAHLQRLQAAVGLFRAFGGGFEPPQESAAVRSVRAEPTGAAAN